MKPCLTNLSKNGLRYVSELKPAYKSLLLV